MPPEFHFLRPYWLLALIPLAVLTWRLLRRPSGADVWRGLVDAHLLSHLLEDDGVGTRRLPLVLLGLGWLLAVLALAGPVWERLPQPVYQTEAHRVIVLDISATMNSTDVPPSRLARARFEVLDMLERAAEGQTALLAFGAEPFIVSPLTTDAATIAAQVPNLETELMPLQGAKRTDLALGQAGDLLRGTGSMEGEVILVTDGLERTDATRSAARKLLSDGFRVSVLGVGTETGAPIPVTGGGFLTDAQGAIELQRLEPGVLASVAAAGGGRYITATADDADVEALIPANGGRFSRNGAERDERADQWREEGPWLLLALLPVAALGFRRGWLSPLLLLLLVAPHPPVFAFGWDDLWLRPDQQGAKDFSAGEHARAADRFRRPDWQAAAQYEAGDYDRALQTLVSLAGAEASYNKGNALARLGNYEEAVAEYERVLSEVPDHQDARHNRDLLRRLLEQQQRQQSQSNQSQSGQSQSGSDPSGQGQQGEDGQQDQDRGRGDGSSGQTQSGQNESDQGDAQQDSSAKGERQGDSASNTSGESAGQSRTGDQQQESTGRPGSETATRQQASAGQDQTDSAGDRSTRESEQGADAPGGAGQAQDAGELDSAADRRQDGTDPSGPSDGRQSGAPPDLDDLLASPQGQSRSAATPQAESENREDRQAMEHMLRRVPDDPGGLLRQRFLLQHLRRSGRIP